MKTDTPLPRPSLMPWARSKREYADWGMVDDAEGMPVANLGVSRLVPIGWFELANWVNGPREPPQITANVAALEALMELRWRKGPPTEPGRYVVQLTDGTYFAATDFLPCDIAWHFPIPELPGEGE